jgi:hypothetical protein
MSFSHVVTLVFLDDPGRQPLRMCTFHFIVKEIEILPAIPKLASGQLKTGSHVSWVVVHHGSGKTWGVEWQAWVRKDPTNWLFVPNLLTTSNFLRSFYPFYPRSCVLKNGQLASWQFFCIIRLYTEDAVESRLPSHTPGEVGTVITIWERDARGLLNA